MMINPNTGVVNVAAKETMRIKRPINTTLLAILLLIVCHSAASETSRGRIFDDRNRNGSFDPGETGVSGVAVSNGEAVVLTDDSGRYELEIEPGDVLFFSKPRGYALPLRKDNIPRFYYAHFPAGTPSELEYEYGGMAPTGTLPGQIDFPVYQAEEPTAFNVIWTADPQVDRHEELDFVRDDVVTELVGVKAAFGLTLGDIVSDDLSLFPRYALIYSQIGVPWFNVAGNHDADLQATTDDRTLDTYTRHFGPRYYSFNWGKTHFVLLDNIFYLSPNSGEPVEYGKYEARLDERQLAWLENDLTVVPNDTLVVLGMHSPFRNVNEPDEASSNLQNLPEVLSLLRRFENVSVVAGHMHTTEHYYFVPEDGWHGKIQLHQHTIAAVSGSWWMGPRDDRGIPYSVQMDGTPNGYHIMTVDGTGYSMRYKAAGFPEDYQMRIMLQTAPGDHLVSNIESSQLASSYVLINVFDGGPNTIVEIQVDDEDYVATERTVRKEPFAQHSYDKDEWPPMFETLSNHLWTAPLPVNLAPGPHILNVQAVDEYGRLHLGTIVFEVE
jgi:hypothetical protein